MIWDWEYAAEVTPALLQAAIVTLQATLAGFSVAAVLGLLLAILRFTRPTSEVREGWFKRILGWVVEFIRTTPLLVQLYFLYYVLPVFGVTLSAFTVGTIGLGVHYATYLAEVYRAGIEAVPKGQWEASRALNHSTRHTWGRVILPQSVPPMLPVLGNYFISMLKETPLLAAITLIEMLSRAKLIGIEHYRYLEPLTIVGVLFILMSLTGSLGVRVLEKRVEKSHANNSTGLIRKSSKGVVI